MFDQRIRARLDRPLQVVAVRLDVPWLSPDRLTIAGLGLGVASAVCAAKQWWALSLLLWLVSRFCDGLDGPLARHRGAQNSAGPLDRERSTGRGGASNAGGFLDITADFVVYGATVVGVGIGVTSGRGASWLPFVLVLLAYYVNGTAFLAFSSIAERAGRRIDDGRSLNFLGGLAEGAETIAVHTLWLLLPGSAGAIAGVWAAVVTLSSGQRIVAGYRALS